MSNLLHNILTKTSLNVRPFRPMTKCSQNISDYKKHLDILFAHHVHNDCRESRSRYQRTNEVPCEMCVRRHVISLLLSTFCALLQMLHEFPTLLRMLGLQIGWLIAPVKEARPYILLAIVIIPWQHASDTLFIRSSCHNYLPTGLLHLWILQRQRRLSRPWSNERNRTISALATPAYWPFQKEKCGETVRHDRWCWNTIK